jgi:D-alanyl-D-alanine carboxypeptidase
VTRSRTFRLFSEISCRKILKGFFAALFLFSFLFIPANILVSKNHAAQTGDDSLQAMPVKKVFPEYDVEVMPGIAVNERYIRAGLLYDVELNKVVWHKNLDKAFPIASITKMMVALIAMEEIKAGKTGWDSLVTVTPEAWKMNGSKVGLRKNETYSMKNLVDFSMVCSANDACCLLAQQLGGSEEAFVYRMIERAEQLGMNNTCFSNSTGMPAIPDSTHPYIKDNYSSPADLLILANELIKYPELLSISSQKEVILKRRYRRYIHPSHNSLAVQYPGEVDGLKTGWTVAAGCCVVTTSNRGGRRLIAIVLGARKSSTRNIFVANLINNYYKQLGLGKLGEKIKTSSPADSLLQANEIKPAPTFEKPASPPSSSFEKKYYTVRAGENLSVIAKKFGTTPEKIMKWNRLTGTTISGGQKLVVYIKAAPKTTSASMNTGASQPLPPDKSSAPSGSSFRYIYHVVQPGDTLWNIAQRYQGVTVEQIKKINNIQDARNLVPGMKLKIAVSG